VIEVRCLSKQRIVALILCLTRRHYQASPFKANG
jgi:hypothetical protein